MIPALLRLFYASVALLTLVGSSAMAMPPQTPAAAARVDTTLRADFPSLDALLKSLPNIAPPAFDEERALWLASLPMACLDRLQPRPGGRGTGRGTAPPDTSPLRGTGRASTPGDSSAARGRGAGTGAGANAVAGRGADSAGRGRAAGAAGANPNDSTGRGRAAGAGATGGGGGGSGAGYFWVTSYSLIPDHDRLRAFWGCNDWHSAVSSTWVLARLLKTFPNSQLGELAREKLNAHLARSNLDGEIAFFRAAAAAINPIPSANQQGLFERPLGFAWLLRLQTELKAWPDSQAQRWAANVGPLATWMADGLVPYLDKLVDPVRGGGQTNTALSMTLAFDYADAVVDVKLRRGLVANARRFYLADTSCATQSERVPPFGAAGARGAAGAAGGAAGGRGAAAPGGRGAATAADSAARATAPNDLTASARGGRGGTTPAPTGGGTAAGAVLSPCLTEAALMSRVLEPLAYVKWLGKFLPPLQSGRFAPLTEAIEIPVAALPPSATAAGPATAATRAGDSTSTVANAGASATLATERARRAELSFARAQAMERIARALPAADARVAALHRLSAIQADRGFALMRDDATATSWLPAQALLYGAVRKR